MVHENVPNIGIMSQDAAVELFEYKSILLAKNLPHWYDKFSLWKLWY